MSSSKYNDADDTATSITNMFVVGSEACWMMSWCDDAEMARLVTNFEN